MHSREFSVDTAGQRGVHDLTPMCAAFAADAAAAGNSMLDCFVPHATAGVLVMELGSGSETDVMEALDRLLPRDDRWRHRHGSAGHGADHVLPLLAGPSLSVPVVGSSRWAPGSPSPCSIPTGTAVTGGCGFRSCPAQRALPRGA